jgi:hypothetical protein
VPRGCACAPGCAIRRHALVGPHEQVRGHGRRAEERRTVALQGSQCRHGS